ncbi:hypothetical protein [Microbacterium thalassium]|uniref:Peptidoglycan/LPS O-acetylase OafA/YrhL n=1 Tax=Microbacterium thalassium TaxID=362649 RepID=A0A7X0FMF5_9MICO|nr:hypothetical protein [Microbacterium thalassium]MBB6390119.1 peptidoglycan/LPS O-acetylase OafA/YrhL [Microbacterium thalassium]GLK25227.1 hypothetical protein GCM10017607_25460 [Microbacterium thalassium]
MNAFGRRLDHAALALGAGAVVAAGYAALALPGTLNFIRSGMTGVLVLLIGGVLAMLAAWRHLRFLVIVAGALLVVAAVVQVATLAGGAFFGGDASLMAVCGGLGIGLLAVGAPRRPAESEDPEHP